MSKWHECCYHESPFKNVNGAMKNLCPALMDSLDTPFYYSQLKPVLHSVSHLSPHNSY